MRAPAHAAAVAIAALLVSTAAAGAQPNLGRRLFEGQVPLDGVIIGHNRPLPAKASRCANCHAASPVPSEGTGSYAGLAKRPRQPVDEPNPGPSDPTPVRPTGGPNPYATQTDASFGPSLNAGLLTRPVQRRGGPASVYDEAAFCKLLRTGIDPAYVSVTRTMPRYASVTDAQCHALWTYLSRI